MTEEIKIRPFNEEFKIKPLHAIFVNKGFIYNEEACDYEKYLLELVNDTIYFREKSKFQVYTRPKSESCSECDCNSESYKMDFKLLDSTTRLRASNELSGGIQKFYEGVIGRCTPKKIGDSQVAIRLHAVLREYNYIQLKEIHEEKQKLNFGTIKYDLKNYVDMLSTKKNLFLFFPYEFFLERQFSFRRIEYEIKTALEHDFKESGIYRSKFFSYYDTYISCIYDDNLLIYEFIDGGKLKFIDNTYLFKSKTFQKLNSYL